jgi:hypothetical protein
MALAWKAGWVQALAGSNPASSASPKQALTCGNAVRIRSARDGVASNIEGGQSQFRSQFPAADHPKSGLPPSRRVRRRSLMYASPDQPAAKAGVVAFTRVSFDLCREDQCLTQMWLTLARSADMPGATSLREPDGLGCRGSPGRALPSLPPARRRLRPPPTPYVTGIPTAAATRRL